MKWNLAAALLLCAPAAAQGGEMFENVVGVLREEFFDHDFRRHELPELAARYRTSARATRSLGEERAVVHDLLSEIPASHLALYSASTRRALLGALSNERLPTLGFQLEKIDARYFVHALLEGGPAERVGLRRGDRVLRIDGVSTGRSRRLDWRSDDAHLDDPQVHEVLCSAGEQVALEVERFPGEIETVAVEARKYSAFDAARASVHVLQHRGHRFGYVHMWYMHYRGLDELLLGAIGDEFADCDGLVLDLRGRGGSPSAVRAVARVLERSWRRPLVALIDRGTRSAKELLADAIERHELGVLVGERTAGAVIPAHFARVGSESWLMFPQTDLGEATRRLELVGVLPDVFAEAPRPYSGGVDPILARGLDVLARLADSVEHG